MRALIMVYCGALLIGCGRSNPPQAVRAADTAAPRLSEETAAADIASTQGSGIFGQWAVDEFGLPAYDYSFDQMADDRALRVELNNTRDHWSQLGNDATIANAYNHGYVQLWSQARLYQWLNRYHEPTRHYAGGYGYLNIDGTVHSTLWLDRDAGTQPLRRFGVGYFERREQAADIEVRETVTSPWGDSPALVHEVHLRNTGSAPKTFSWWEYWDVNPEDRTGKRLVGLRQPSFDPRRGLLQVQQLADGDDTDPMTIFLAAAEAPVEGFETDLGTFFGSGTRAVPGAVASDAAGNSIAAPFPGAATNAPNRGSTLLALRAPLALAPGEARTLRYVYGLAHAAAIDGVIAAVRAEPDTRTATAHEWRRWLPQMDFGPGRGWLNRELQWAAYMVRSSSMYEETCGYHVVTQGGYYQYGAGQQIAFRDPLQHMLPLIYSDHELAREVLRYSFQQQPAETGAIAYGMGPLCARIDLGTSNDLDAWLLLSAVEYVLAARDLAFLDESLPYRGGLPGPALVEGSIWEHVKLAYFHQENLVPRGPMGHYLIGATGDWSDFSTQFLQMTESVLVTAQLAYLYPRLAELAELKGDQAFADQVRARGAELVEKTRGEWTGLGWYARGYSGTSQIGHGAIFGEPQPWAILAGAPDAAQATTLVANIRRFLSGVGAPPELHGPARVGSTISPAAADPEVTETSTGPQGVGDGNAVYVGGIWFAINGALTWALARLDGSVPGAADAALDELQRNTLSAHAEAYPERWNGVLNVDDACWSWFSSDPGRCAVNILVTLGGTAGQITHQPAWTWFAALKLAGIEPTRGGYRIAPHLPLAQWSLRLPNIGLAQDDARLRGYVRAAADGPLEFEVLPRGAGTRSWRVFVNGTPADPQAMANGGVRFSAVAKAGVALDWALEPAP